MAKPGRNDRCPCGSGKKYKACCLTRDEAAERDGLAAAQSRRVERAAAQSGARATYWEGSFAGFAHVIAGSSLYVGYDSAGQHVAAACGVPLISIFAGFAAPRMFDRWRPSGPRATVIRVDQPDLAEILAEVARALA